jgi:hypothetical protein
MLKKAEHGKRNSLQERKEWSKEEEKGDNKTI